MDNDHRNRPNRDLPTAETLLRRPKAELLTIYMQWSLREQQTKAKAEVSTHAQLIKNYRIVVIKTEREAIRIGVEMKNCLRDLRLPPELRDHDMSEFINALSSGRLMALCDAAGKTAAILRYKGDMLVEVSGFANGGVLHGHAIMLRDYVMSKNIPTHVNAAERIGLVYIPDQGYVGYEQVLPQRFSEDNVDVAGWPVTDDDMLALRGRNGLERLNVFACASVTCIPLGVGFKEGERYGVFVDTRAKQQKPMSVDEANAYLAYKQSIRPKDFPSREIISPQP